MVSEEDFPVGGEVVHVVAQGVGGRGAIGVEAEDAAGEKLRVHAET